MLIDHPPILTPDPVRSVIAAANGNPITPSTLATGVYLIGHFGSSSFLPGFDPYPKLTINPYGVCDVYEQVLRAAPEIATSESRQFVLTLTPVRKRFQPAEGGWRWRKWGPYIGVHKPTCEYLHD